MRTFIFPSLFPSVLNMSITASVVILFVLLVRLLLRKAPKIFSYALWCVVLFRLLCPVSIPIDFSLLGLLDTPVQKTTAYTTSVEYVPHHAEYLSKGGVQLPVTPIIPPIEGSELQQKNAVTEIEPMGTPMSAAEMIWLMGLLGMLVYSLASYFLLRRRLIGTVLLRDNIYLADGIETPFVMGCIRPKIYLPSILSEQEQGYIILHERHHIHRGDHLLKMLAFLALSIHWFNPLVWAAFVLSSKDMEMSCDEAVVRKLGEAIRTDYSASLLRLAVGRRRIAGMPLAFGEGDTRSRIKNILRWKQPKTWLFITALMVCVAVVGFCAANPQKNSTENDSMEVWETDDVSLGTPVSREPENIEIPEPPEDTENDISYYLELAADTEFRDMNPNRLIKILREYEDLLDDYILVARESTDGKTAYIVGQFKGDPTQSPLHGMYGVEVSVGKEDVFQFLYREEESETVDAVLAANKTEFPPSAGYRIESSTIYWSADSGRILIQPKDTELSLDVAWNHCLYTPNGREYIADAVSRGIDLCGRTDTFLYVYRLSEQFGEIAERIALTEAEAQAILEEERVNFNRMSATLHINGETIYYGGSEGVPQSVYDLAMERCDYRFSSPNNITGEILQATLVCDWLDRPLRADVQDLLRLRDILKDAEFGYVGGCGYGAKLILTMKNGEQHVIFKGCDGCDTVVFGSYGGYFLGDKQNIEFWKMFGLDPETKEPIAEVEPKTFSDILGYSGYVISDGGRPWEMRTYYAAVGDEMWPIAESFGFGEAEDYVVDLDGDGITELVANVTYGGDGVRKVYVYQRRGESIYIGTLSSENLPNFDDWGANAVWSEYDPEDGVFRLHYAQKGCDDYAVQESRGLEDFQFEVFQPVDETGMP